MEPTSSMKKDDIRRRQFEGCVVAALETGAKLRSPRAGVNPSGAITDPIDRTAATIEAESARIQARDPGAIDAVFASQALMLDTLFTQIARRAVEDGWLPRDTLALALKAQSQSRTTLKSLAPMAPPGEGRAHTQSVQTPVGSDTAQKPNSSEQNIESVDS
jgi:hypothetical protein